MAARGRDAERDLLKREWRKFKSTKREYVAAELGEAESKGYFAAGVLLLRFVESEWCFLAVLERRKKKGRGSKGTELKLNVPGGKREAEDNADVVVTAMRELDEETGGVLGTPALLRLVRRVRGEEEVPGAAGDWAKRHRAVWLPSAKYVVMVAMAPPEVAGVTEEFARAKQGDCEEREQGDGEVPWARDPAGFLAASKTSALCWVPISQLLSMGSKGTIVTGDESAAAAFLLKAVRSTLGNALGELARLQPDDGNSDLEEALSRLSLGETDSS